MSLHCVNMDPSSSIVSLRPARTLRLRAPTTRTHNVGTSSTAASDPSTGRPTVLELERAERMRERLKAAQIIGDRGQPAKLKVIACAIAMSVKDATFKDDREAKGLFGVEKDTKIRRDCRSTAAPSREAGSRPSSSGLRRTSARCAARGLLRASRTSSAALRLPRRGWRRFTRSNRRRPSASGCAFGRST